MKDHKPAPSPNDIELLKLLKALAPGDVVRFEARLCFGRFIGMVSGEENTYFRRAFEALGVVETREFDARINTFEDCANP